MASSLCPSNASIGICSIDADVCSCTFGVSSSSAAGGVCTPADYKMVFPTIWWVPPSTSTSSAGGVCTPAGYKRIFFFVLLRQVELAHLPFHCHIYFGPNLHSSPKFGLKYCLKLANLKHLVLLRLHAVRQNQQRLNLY